MPIGNALLGLQSVALLVMNPSLCFANWTFELQQWFLEIWRWWSIWYRINNNTLMCAMSMAFHPLTRLLTVAQPTLQPNQNSGKGTKISFFVRHWPKPKPMQWSACLPASAASATALAQPRLVFRSLNWTGVKKRREFLRCGHENCILSEISVGRLWEFKLCSLYYSALKSRAH